MQDAIGSFANSLALRTVLPRDGSFVDVVAAAKRTTLDAIAHHRVSFDEVVAAVNPDRGHGRTPVYQVLFGWQDTEPIDLDLGREVRARRYDVERTTAVLDLSILLKPGERDQVDLVLEYSDDCFVRQSIERFGGHLLAALEELTQDPQSPLGLGANEVEARR